MKFYLWVGVFAMLFSWWMLDLSFTSGIVFGGLVAMGASWLWEDSDGKKPAAPPTAPPQTTEAPPPSAKGVAAGIAKKQAEKVVQAAIKRWIA